MTLQNHLESGATHLCHAWAITRRDGLVMGFTDHDQPLVFDGIRFAPETALGARALAGSTGLAVNNSECFGALSSDAITEGDITAGRYDGAELLLWQVRWDAPDQRALRFAGTLGEISRAAGGFQAELRGLSEMLNQPQGRSYLPRCDARFGDARCRVDLAAAGMQALTIVLGVEGDHVILPDLPDFAPGWFTGGVIAVLTGQAAQLSATIRDDRHDGDQRRLTLWEPLRAALAPGDQLRLTAGCDKSFAMCRARFGNELNFRGFPDIPGDDWLLASPRPGSGTGGRGR
jgi:uncharacterized phage protein (TIGR02218 family)